MAGDRSATDDAAGDAATRPRPYDHVAVADGTPAVRRTAASDGDDGALDAGTFRVVGVGPDEVTLLRVTDASGRRVNSGELVAVPREAFDSLDAAENPDETGALSTWGMAALGALLAAAGSVPAVVAATGLSGDAVTAAGIAVLAVGVVRVLRTRR